MSAEQAALNFVEVAGLGFHQGSAVMAIADGNFARAKYHIERLMVPQLVALPAPQSTPVAEDIPNVQVVQRTKPLGKSKGKAQVVQSGYTTCKRCGKAKGKTAFARGDNSGVCRYCQEGAVKAPKAKRDVEVAPTLRAYPVERPTLSKDESVKREAYWRECKKCKRKLGVRAFRGDEAVCRQCEGDK